jgi:CRP/FNR family transcriptional regulator, anaerobic regulatory protein
MAEQIQILQNKLPFLGDELLHAFIKEGTWMELEAGVQLLREGQYVKVVPIVLEGLVKVYTQTDTRELLLYYIRPSESCIMSLSAVMHNDTSKIFALTEEASTLLLIPAEKISQLLANFPKLNLRYAEMIETIQQLLFNKLDQRIYDYLEDLSTVKGTRILDIRHRQIAQDLGTAREVITRTLKKLEKEGKIRQTERGIELI